MCGSGRGLPSALPRGRALGRLPGRLLRLRPVKRVWGSSGRFFASVDDAAQPYRLSLIGVCRRGVQDAGHGLLQGLQGGDLVVDGIQAGLKHGDDLVAGRCPAPAQADDGADLGQAEPEVTGLTDEPQQLDVVLGVAAVAGGGPLCGRQQAAGFIQPDGLGGQPGAPRGLTYGEDRGGNVCLLLEAGA